MLVDDIRYKALHLDWELTRLRLYQDQMVDPVSHLVRFYDTCIGWVSYIEEIDKFLLKYIPTCQVWLIIIYRLGNTVH